MLMEYIEKNYSNSDPIFIKELPYSSKDSLRQEMKKLTDEGKLIRVINGVYYKPFKTIFGTVGKMSITKFIEKRYIIKNDVVVGFLSGISLYNKYGFTTQIPSVIEVTSNEASTIQRKLKIDGYNIVVYKPEVYITQKNIKELEFLALMTDIDKYSEIKGDELKNKLRKYVEKKKIDFEVVKEYLQFYPCKVYKNLFVGGLMDELV